MKTPEVSTKKSRISVEVKEIQPWVGQYSFSPYAYESSPDGDDADGDDIATDS